MTTHQPPNPARPPSLVDTDPEEIEEPFDLDPETLEPVGRGDDEEIPDQDVGDLYGVHQSKAADTELAAPEDHDGFRDSELGENFLEALEERAAEGGPEPEHPVDVIDDDITHRYHSKSDHRDRPVADKGAGGPAGR